MFYIIYIYIYIFFIKNDISNINAMSSNILLR